MVNFNVGSSWAAVKDLVSGELKNIPVAQIITLLPGKQYRQFTPSHLSDFSSRGMYGRIKRDPSNTLNYMRRIKILHMRPTQDEIEVAFKKGQIKNPASKLYQAELMSEFKLKEDKLEAQSKRKIKLAKRSNHDSMEILEKYKKKKPNQEFDEDEAAESVDENVIDPAPATGSFVVKPTDDNRTAFMTVRSDVSKVTAQVPNAQVRLDVQVNTEPPKAAELDLIVNTEPPKASELDVIVNTEPPKAAELDVIVNTEPSKAAELDNILASTSAFPSVNDFLSCELDEETPGEQNKCVCREVLVEVRELKNEIAELKALITGSSIPSPSQGKTDGWPVFNAVCITLSAPEATPPKMIYCGESARYLGVSAVEKVIMGGTNLRMKVMSLASLMFPENLPKLWLRQNKEGENRELFPLDSKLAIHNLINIGLKVQAGPEGFVEEVPLQTISELLSKGLNHLRKVQEEAK